MNTAKKLMMVLRGSGGGPPESITDDFATDSGLWLDGNLASAAITVSGGRGVWAPTLGAEKVSDPGFDSWVAGVPGDWLLVNAGDSAVTETAPDGSAGTGAAKITSTTSATRPLIYSANLTNAQWNMIAITISTYTSGALIVANSAADYARISGAATHYIAAYAPNANLYMYNSAVGLNMVLDNVSSKPITLTTMFRVQQVFYPSSVSVEGRYLRAAPVGVVVYQDSSNWVAALITPVKTSTSTNQVILYRCVAGTLSVVTSAAITYSADAVLQLTPAADYQTWSVAYGGSTVINAASITNFTASGVWYAGMVTTHDAGDTAVVGFGNFAASRVAGAPPF